jgi:hypothetical protein
MDRFSLTDAQWTKMVRVKSDRLLAACVMSFTQEVIPDPSQQLFVFSGLLIGQPEASTP